MNNAKKQSRRMAKAERRKATREGRALEHLRARDLKGKPRLYPPRDPEALAREAESMGWHGIAAVIRGEDPTR